MFSEKTKSALSIVVMCIIFIPILFVLILISIPIHEARQEVIKTSGVSVKDWGYARGYKAALEDIARRQGDCFQKETKCQTSNLE